MALNHQCRWKIRHKVQKYNNLLVDCVWNVVAHVKKPDFVFRRNGRIHLNRRGRQFSRLRAAELYVSAGYTMFRGSVKSTGYPIHSPVSPSLPLPCVTVCHHISTGLYSSWYSGSESVFNRVANELHTSESFLEKPTVSRLFCNSKVYSPVHKSLLLKTETF